MPSWAEVQASGTKVAAAWEAAAAAIVTAQGNLRRPGAWREPGSGAVLRPPDRVEAK